VSVVGGVEADHLNILNTVVKLAQIDGLLVDVVAVEHLLLLLLLKSLSLFLSKSHFFLGGLSLGLLVGLLLGNLNILLNLDLVFDLHSFFVDFLVPLFGVPVVVLHVSAIGLHVVSVVLVWDSLVTELDESLVIGFGSLQALGLSPNFYLVLL